MNPEPRIWIDIDNPPQVQYLLPFERAFRQRGGQVIVTARDYGNALDLLAQHETTFHVVGKEFGPRKVAKALGVLRRARKLRSVVAEWEPEVLLCASRSSVLVARRLGIPSFVIIDYEYANLSFFRFARSTVLYPDVIDPASLVAGGIERTRLIPFRGLKEDISIGDVDLNAAASHRFPELRDEALIRVLFRPPAEESHYYDPKSRDLARRALAHLSARSEVILIFLPRYRWQHEDLARFKWSNEPIVLERAVPFVSLLKGVDLVVCSGGTLLREAAYLGVPAYSIFGSRIGGVDRHLASIGRARLIDSTAEIATIELRKGPSLSPLRQNPQLLDDLVEAVLQRTSAGIGAAA